MGAYISGGIRIPSSEWLIPDDALSACIPDAAKPHIRMISLASLDLTPHDWGEEIPVGAYETSKKYDDAPRGHMSSLFCGTTRMVKARYPNAGICDRLDAVADIGDVGEFPEQNYHYDWHERRNHRGGAYILSKATNEHIKHWAHPETAWMFGWFYHGWADSSTPITFDTSIRTVYPKFVSLFGAKADARFWFYNIIDELDSEGEWFLDRKTGKIYFYPPADANSADFAYLTTPLISCKNTCNISFSGFELRTSIATAVLAENCTDMVFENLHILNVDSAMTITGYRNLVQNCEIEHLAESGITVTGGTRENLSHGNNRITNNKIHDFGEVVQTYRPGIYLCGVGNIADHNELYNSAHMALRYCGNEHLIEYNYIHDVCLQTNDAGAIYSGADMTAHGTVLRYNKILRLGRSGSDCEMQIFGIYWDDMLSGQTAYCNYIEGNIGSGFMCGGGRDNTLYNNIVVGAYHAIVYDVRFHEGIRGGWYGGGGNKEKHFAQIRQVQSYDEPWKSRYPALFDVNIGSNFTEKTFIANTTNVILKDNIAIETTVPFEIEQPIYNLIFERNAAYESKVEAGWPENECCIPRDYLELL